MITDEKKFQLALDLARHAPRDGFAAKHRGRESTEFTFSDAGCGCCAECVYAVALTPEQKHQIAEVVVNAWLEWAKEP